MPTPWGVPLAPFPLALPAPPIAVSTGGAFVIPWGVPLGLWPLSRPAYVEPVVPAGLPVTLSTVAAQNPTQE